MRASKPPDLLGDTPRHQNAAAMRDHDAAIEAEDLPRHRALHPVEVMPVPRSRSAVDETELGIGVEARHLQLEFRGSQTSSESRKASRSPRATAIPAFLAAATP